MTIVISVNAAPRPMIIDTDVGIDDEMAILYILKRPTIRVEAITIASDGNAHSLPALKNTLGILKLMHQEHIPVACGREHPLKGNNQYPKKVLRELDTLAGTNYLLPVVNHLPTDTAVNLLKTTLEKTKTSIDILAIGPLTNIAEFIQKYPKLKNRIHMIYLMGGAIHVPGNIQDVDKYSDNTSAEWNIYIDPYAADKVFRSGIPITLVPLDVTNTLPIDMTFYKLFQKHHQTHESNIVYEIMHHNENLLIRRQWYFWDPLAAVVADNESIADIHTENLRVNTQGATVIDNQHGSPIRVCEMINKTKFKQLFLNDING